MTEFNYGRARQPGDYGKSPQAAALRRQLARLADTEQMPVYQEMLAEATARRRAEAALPKTASGRVVGT